MRTPQSDPSDAVFGPVPSRRLGLSLGVDLLPFKTCSLDCLYCELGPTTRKTTVRERFRPAALVLAQVEERLAELDYAPDFLTLAGSGEPTLHLDLGLVLDRLAELNSGRTAVLTNSTLVHLPEVRNDLARASLLVPSLDAVSEEVFRKVNRPAPGLSARAMLEGLIKLRWEHPGEMWLEILLVAGINDHPGEVEALMKAARAISPDKVQLNTVVRPPAAPGVRAVPHHRLAALARAFPVPAEVISPPEAAAGGDRGAAERRIVETTRRRPLTLEDLTGLCGGNREEALALVKGLQERGLLREEEQEGRIFYRGV